MGDLKQALENIEEAKKEGKTSLNLEDLALTTEDFQQLLPKIREIPNLEKLNLRNNAIAQLPDETGHLRTLKNLNLGANQLQELPPTIGNLHQLEYLELYDNKLSKLPATFANLKKLTNLYLDRNQFTQLPEAIGNLSALILLTATSNKLTSLPESMRNLEELRILNLNQNDLNTLPDFITDLGTLQVLAVEANGLSSLPLNLGDLANLYELDIANNHLIALPDSIGLLINLERLFAFNNQLTQIPETLVNCPNLEHLTFSGNPLTEQSRNWVFETFGYEIVETNMASYEQLEAIEDVLEALYQKNADAVHDHIEAMEGGDFVTEASEHKTAREVLESFLPLIPIHDPLAPEIYLPAAKNLLDEILDTQFPREKKDAQLHTIATALGDCATPVKSLLIQRAIGDIKALKGELPENFKIILQREAIEQSINQNLKQYLQKNERIEQVQGLLNSVFLEGAESEKDNNVKIEGNRSRLPSKTTHTEYAFQQVSEQLAVEFAKMLCQTGQNNELLLNQHGVYTLDNQKFRAITEKYLAELGIVSEREKLIHHFEKELTAAIKQHELQLHTDNEEVLPLLKINEHKEALRTLLKAAEDEALQQVYAAFWATKQTQIKTIAAKIKVQQPELAGMAVPLNQQQAAEASATNKAGSKRKPLLQTITGHDAKRNKPKPKK